MRISREITATVFGIGIILAAAAFFYQPPVKIERRMQAELARQPVWQVVVNGDIAQSPMYLELVKRVSGEQLLRIAYPPLKLLNNQWIELASGAEWFRQMRLTQRLTTLAQLIRSQEHYAFAFDNSGWPEAWPHKGEVWLDRSWLPVRIVAGDFKATLTYADPLRVEPEVPRRLLPEVVAQLSEIVRMDDGHPKILTPLRSGQSGSAEFLQDFDQDGLSDGLEVFYGTDPANPDTDNDKYLDGVEVQRRYLPTGEGLLN